MEKAVKDRGLCKNIVDVRLNKRPTKPSLGLIQMSLKILLRLTLVMEVGSSLAKKEEPGLPIPLSKCWPEICIHIF